MKIKRMIVILFVLLSAIPLTIFGLANMAYTNGKLEEILENDLKTAVSTQVKAIENFYRERVIDNEMMIDFSVVGELLDARKSGNKTKTELLRGYVNDLLRSRIAKGHYVVSFTILDTQFNVVACSDARAVGDHSELENMDPKYLSKETKFSHVIESMRTGIPEKIIAAVQEIYDGDSLSGYIVQEINLEFFEEVRVSASLFNNGTIYLVDGKGQMIAAGDTISARDHYQLALGEREDYNRAWAQRDRQSKSGVLRYKARGQHYLSCYSKLDGMDWTMISSVNIDEVLQTKRSFWNLLSLLVLFLIVLRMAVEYFFWVNVAKPIDGMIERFNEIKETQDYSLRMKNTGSNEFGVISREINSLLSSMETYIDIEKEKRRELKKKAERDPLTGAYNKEAIERILRSELEVATRRHGKIAYMFVDVDDFKRFNTEFGHMGGDKVLRFIVDNLTLLTKGKVGRQGGDEFVVCIRDLGREKISEISQSFLQAMNQGVQLEEDGLMISIHCSIGIALLENTALTYEELLSKADEAMYQVKHQGKNSFYIVAVSAEPAPSGPPVP